MVRRPGRAMSSPTDEASFVDNTALLAQVLSLTARVAELESELKIAKGGAAMSFNPITLTIVSECAECVKREAQAEADAVALVVTTAEAEAEAAAETTKTAEAAEATRCAEEAESVALQSKKHIDPPRRVSTKPTVGEVRDAVDVLSNHACGDASLAMVTCAKFLCVKHRDQASNPEGLLRRSIVTLKTVTRETGAKQHGGVCSGFGPSREVAKVLTSTATAPSLKTTTQKQSSTPRASAPAAATTVTSPRRTLHPPGSPHAVTASRAVPALVSSNGERTTARRSSIAKVSLAELRAPSHQQMQWQAEKEKKEQSREKIKKQVVERDARWKESIAKRQTDRLKFTRKAEEAAEAGARMDLLRSRTKAREDALSAASTPVGSPIPGNTPGSRHGTPGSRQGTPQTPTIAMESERLFGEC